MRKLIFIFFLFISFVSKAQVYQEMPQYGYRANRMAFDSTLQIPTTCGVPTLKSNVLKKAAIAFDSCNNKIYRYNPKTLTWSEISGGSGGSQNLQEVTDIGDTTTNSIYANTINIFDSANGEQYWKITANDLLNIRDLNGKSRLALDAQADGIALYGLNGSALTLKNDSITSNKTLFFPNKNGTFALTSDITTIDTANKWVNSITKTNDSTLQVIKGTTTTDLTITGASYATKLKTKVWNTSGASIPRGAVVYINGAHSSNLPTIALAKANDEATSAYTYGLVEDTIANNSSGTVIQNGVITNLNLPTSTYTDGQTLYLSPTVAGGYTLTKPLAPNHYVAIGTITRAHPNFGTIQVAIRNGFQLDELSDVNIALVPADSTLLQFSRVDSLWHDVSVTNAIGTKYLKPTDTASLSSRINLKMNISDTSTMLTKYLRKTDTATLSSRIDAKGYALNLGGTNATINASSTYYLGIPGLTITSSAAIRRVYIPQSGTIKNAQFYVKTTNATSTENWTISIRLNNSSNTTLATVGNALTDKEFKTTSLSIAVNTGDYIEITTTTPAFVTAPGSTYIYGSIFIQ